MTRLHLPAEPTSYGADSRLPAPEWLIAETPGAEPLLAALIDAREAAKRAANASREAITAFREASRTDGSGDYIPLPTIEYDRWRQLKATMDDARAVADKASRAVKPAWLDLRYHIALSPEAYALAAQTAEDRRAELVASIESLQASVVSFAETERMLPQLTARQQNNFGDARVAIGSEVGRIVRELRDVLDPKPSTYTWKSAASA